MQTVATTYQEPLQKAMPRQASHDQDHHLQHDQHLPTQSIQRPHSVFSVRDFAYNSDEELHYGWGLVFGKDLFDDDDDFEDETTLHRASFLPNWGTYADGPPWLMEEDSKQGGDMELEDNEIHGKAIALFDFEPENDNEVKLTEGQVIWISYRYGQGWLVAEDDETGQTGLVPEEYVQLLSNDTSSRPQANEDAPSKVIPDLSKAAEVDDDDNWVDEDDDELPAVEALKIE